MLLILPIRELRNIPSVHFKTTWKDKDLVLDMFKNVNPFKELGPQMAKWALWV